MDSSPFRGPLEAASRHAIDYLDSLNARPVAEPVALEALRDRLARPLTDAGVSADEVIGDLVQDAAPGLVSSAGGRFFAWVIGGAVPAALAADWLTGAWDQNAGLYASAPSAAIVEEIAGEWLKELLGLPAGASFAFVTGCQMAHVTCLAAARHHALEARGWDVEQRGLYGAPPLRLLASRECHGTIQRAVRLLGLGVDHMVEVPSGPQGQLDPEALDRALSAEPDRPAIVVLQAGELNTGIFDPFETLIPIAKQHGAWVHIDGAFGLWAAASPRFRRLTAGAGQADSWATDGHKWLNVPYDCGYAFVADPGAQRASMAYRASYLNRTSEAREEMDWNPEWSRRARGFATYAAIRQLGRAGIAGMIEHCCHHARALVAGIGALPAAEVLWEPVINQGLVRFLHPDHAASEEANDRHTDDVIARITASGEAFFGGVTWRGRRAMRISVCNWQTSELDVERAIQAVADAVVAAAGVTGSTPA